MKKKTLIILFSFFMALIITGCGKTENETISKENSIDYKTVQREMSNYICGNSFYIENGWVYGSNFDSEGSSLFAKFRTDGSDYSVIKKKTYPTHVQVDGEFIYVVLRSGDNSNLYRCRLGGNDFKKLNKDNICEMQISSECIYYNKIDLKTNKTKGFYKSDKDGKNEECVIDKEIYYPYVIENTVYYQDGSNGEKIYSYDLDTKESKQITEGISYCFITDGEYGYYINNNKSVLAGDNSGNLVKINLETKEETVLYEGVYTGILQVVDDKIFFCNMNDQSRLYSIGKDGSNINLVSQDSNVFKCNIYGDKIIYAVADSSESYTDNIYISNLDGSNKTSIIKD